MLTHFLLVALAGASPVQDDPDLLRMKDGKEIACRVLFEDEQKVVYRAKKKNQEVARAEVSEVQSVERSLHAFLERFGAIDPTDVSAVTELALFAEENYLPGEAHNAWIRVLTLDPANERAWTKLGGVKRRDGWELKVRGRYYGIEELRTRVSDWKNALELRTAHFLIRTDAAPEMALDAAIDVERAFLKFYDVLAKPLGLYVFDEVPEIHAFRDPKDYPAPPTPGRSAWFSIAANTLYVDAQERRNRGDIIAEFVDALVLNSFRRTLDQRTGELEPWAREGLRQAFALAARPDPGRLTFDFDSPNAEVFRSQAEDKEPLSLEQVLRAGFASFDSGSDARRYATQAYTLTHFLVFYDGGKYRPGYAEFLRSSFEGKSGTSNFFKALGVKEKELEEQWRAHVGAVAGA